MARHGRPEQPGDEVHPVSVASLGWHEAWILVGRLRSEGVPCRVHPDWYSPPHGAVPGPWGAWAPGPLTYDVLVPEEFADEARKIVAKYISL